MPETSPLRSLALLIVVAAVSACSTTPVPLSEAKFIPDQLLYRDASPNTAPVIVRRDRGFAGSGCKAQVFVEGDLAAYLGTGEAVKLNIPAGNAIIGADPGTFCGGGTVEEAITLVSGQPAYLRIARDGNGTFRLMRTLDR